MSHQQGYHPPGIAKARGKQPGSRFYPSVCLPYPRARTHPSTPPKKHFSKATNKLRATLQPLGAQRLLRGEPGRMHATIFVQQHPMLLSHSKNLFFF